MAEKIGITTTIPVEIVLAAGFTPVDLNNIFITDSDPPALVRVAEQRGYPGNTCCWVKGMYGAVKKNPYINKIIAVTQGDCTNTLAMVETLQHNGMKIFPFAYPFDKDMTFLSDQMQKLAGALGTTIEAAEGKRQELINLRKKLQTLDRLTWEENVITGQENHYYLVSSSDFNQDPEKFEKEVDDFFSEIKERAPLKKNIRLGFAGVPPVLSDLYRFIEEKGARVVFNEVQRQFAMNPECDGLLGQYLSYTYPYDIKGRIEDIKREVKKRGVQGVIHYVQSFCHHQIEDIILRDSLDVPVLTLEGDKPGAMDARTRLRIESFIEML
ncbi:MAG: 2-hydroxyacyl-CoA dehydratase family protein [Firmicutes bacterium]|nr:2-hydroxyacyl-CoA dehydratase family protein [Bacillota bacterium]